jgi:hypothetical protein
LVDSCVLLAPVRKDSLANLQRHNISHRVHGFLMLFGLCDC